MSRSKRARAAIRGYILLFVILCIVEHLLFVVRLLLIFVRLMRQLAKIRGGRQDENENSKSI
jgi:hypothetical protein